MRKSAVLSRWAWGTVFARLTTPVRSWGGSRVCYHPKTRERVAVGGPRGSMPLDRCAP